MTKTAAYSWRLSPDLKLTIEEAARRNGEDMAGFLQRLVREELARSAGPDAGDKESQRRAAAVRFFGTFDGGDPDRAANARQILRKRLGRRYRSSP